MKHFFIFFTFFYITLNSFSQNLVVINNNTYIRVTNSNIIIFNDPISNTIQKIGPLGGFFTPTENEKIIINLGNNTGLINIPFASSIGNTIPFQFNVTISGLGGGKIMINTYETPDNNIPYPTGVTHLLFNGIDNSQMVIDRFWNIDMIGYINNPKGVFLFSYDDNDLVGNSITESNLFLQRWNSDLSSWGDWLSSPFVNPINNNISINVTSPMLQYRSWTLVDYTQPLPVSLIIYECDCLNNKLIWVTESESNNDKFIIEGSDDLINYVDIDSISGNGFSNTEIQYSYSLFNWRFEYIRLKQRDFNGKIKIFDPKKSCETNNIANIILYPNPNSGVFTIDHNSTFMFSLYDINGKLLFEKNTSENSFDFSYLESGTYLIKMKNSNKILNFKFVKK